MVNIKRTYSQFDPQWANVTLGYNSDPKYNFYNFACLITNLAMIATYYGYDENPLSINNKLKTIEGYVKGTGLYIHGKFSQLFPTVNEKIVRTPNPLSDSQMNEIREALQKGYPVMLFIDQNPKTVKPDQHFVLAIDMGSDENDIKIVDPLGGKIRSLRDYLGWFRPSARKSIEAYFIYEGAVLSDNKGQGQIFDPPQVRDMLVTKATEFDRICDFVGIREEQRTVFSGNKVIDYIKQLKENEIRLQTDLDNSIRYNDSLVSGFDNKIPTDQDKNILFRNIGDVLTDFFNKFKR